MKRAQVGIDRREFVKAGLAGAVGIAGASREASAGGASTRITWTTPKNGRKVVEVLEARGRVVVKYEEIDGISHEGIYREGFEEATKLELDWFATHRKADADPG